MKMCGHEAWHRRAGVPSEFASVSVVCQYEGDQHDGEQ